MKANLDKNLAPAWVSGKSYSIGDFCLYNKRLYICTTDNSDAEFDNSKWEIRNLVDLVSGINSNLGGEFICIPIRNLLNNSITVETNGKKYVALIVDTYAGNADTVKMCGSTDGSSYVVIDAYTDAKVAKVYDIQKYTHVRYENLNTNSAYASGGVLLLTNNKAELVIN